MATVSTIVVAAGEGRRLGAAGPKAFVPLAGKALFLHSLERLGQVPGLLEQVLVVPAGSKARAVYGQEVVYERHRHRFEVNNRYRQTLEGAGMLLSGISPDSRLVEIVELRDHPWFVASQFHPEFKSRPERPHPLFHGFVATAIALRDGREPELTAVGAEAGAGDGAAAGDAATTERTGDVATEAAPAS